jgi:hypothetical protein
MDTLISEWWGIPTCSLWCCAHHWRNWWVLNYSTPSIPDKHLHFGKSIQVVHFPKIYNGSLEWWAVRSLLSPIFNQKSKLLSHNLDLILYLFKFFSIVFFEALYDYFFFKKIFLQEFRDQISKWHDLLKEKIVYKHGLQAFECCNLFFLYINKRIKIQNS